MPPNSETRITYSNLTTVWQILTYSAISLRTFTIIVFFFDKYSLLTLSFLGDFIGFGKLPHDIFINGLHNFDLYSNICVLKG
jgi:hypothetical protein